MFIVNIANRMHKANRNKNIIDAPICRKAPEFSLVSFDYMALKKNNLLFNSQEYNSIQFSN